MTTKIHQKLLEAQKEMGVILKDKDNPYFKSKYADINSILSQVKPVLNKNGLYLMQALTTFGGSLALDTKIFDAETGESIGSEPAVLPPQIDAQKAGSAITYFRRYALQSLLALEAEDDDGNIASGKTKKPKVDTEKPPFGADDMGL